MNGNGFFDILVEFIQGIALSKYVLAYSPSTPKFTVKISFYFY